MEPNKSRNADGTQNVEYYKNYYQKNKDKIKEKNSRRYEQSRSTPDGIQKHRDLCTRNSKTYREKYPAKIKEQRKRLHLSRKAKALLRVGDLCCSNCSCNEIDFLEFNHKDGNGSKEFKGNNASMMDKILAHGRRTDDLNILCRVCNALEYLARKNESSVKRYTVLWEML